MCSPIRSKQDLKIMSNCPPTKHQSEDEEEVAGHIDLAERIQATLIMFSMARICLIRYNEFLVRIHPFLVCLKSRIKIIENQVENFLPYLTGKKQLTPRARDLTFCNWATNKVSDFE